MHRKKCSGWKEVNKYSMVHWHVQLLSFIHSVSPALVNANVCLFAVFTLPLKLAVQTVLSDQKAIAAWNNYLNAGLKSHSFLPPRPVIHKMAARMTSQLDGSARFGDGIKVASTDADFAWMLFMLNNTVATTYHFARSIACHHSICKTVLQRLYSVVNWMRNNLFVCLLFVWVWVNQ